MTRTHLLGAASAAALACLSSFAQAEPYILGGGSTLAQFDYGNFYGQSPVSGEFSIFNAAKPTATFSTYWQSGSGTGQQAFIEDNLTCDISKVKSGTADCTGVAGKTGNTVDYGASDAVLSAAQISSWATSSFGQAAAGDLIQLPSMGVGISIPVVNSAVTTNGGATLSDNDLCGIFSGKITNFDQITDFKNKLKGAFEVAYRSDGSGTSFLLTNHLSAVCTSSNTAAGITFTATTTFASIFPANGSGGYNTPANFVGASGSGGVASYLAGCSSSGAVANGIGYLSPDFTTVDPDSSATLTCANNTVEKSPLVVASVAIGDKSYLPTYKEVQLGLDHVVLGTNKTPPSTAAEAANPALWVPLVQTVSEGYPIVGYTTFDFAQCYSNASVTKNVKLFLTDHYRKSAYATVQNNNGFLTLLQTKATTFVTAIDNYILANTKGFNTDIGDATACKGKVGR
jgi:ABC-type phosphate transport system substrate-binding protein